MIPWSFSWWCMWCGSHCGCSELKSSPEQQKLLTPGLSLQPGVSADPESIPFQGWRHCNYISLAYHKPNPFLIYFCQSLTRSLSLFHLNLRHFYRGCCEFSPSPLSNWNFLKQYIWVFEVCINMTSGIFIWWLFFYLLLLIQIFSSHISCSFHVKLMLLGCGIYMCECVYLYAVCMCVYVL